MSRIAIGRRTLLGFLVAALILVPTLLLTRGSRSESHPSDDVLLQEFAEHEAEFEKLVAMLRADKKLERVDEDWTRPGDPTSIGVMPARIREYRDLFSKLSIPRGFHAFHDPENFTFFASTQGLSVTGSAKGYAYLQKVPDLMVADLGAYWSADGKSFTAYRWIKGNWYLYFDHED